MNSRLNAFNPLWLRDPEFKRWVEKVPNNPQKANCILCERDFIIGDQGHRALKAHASSARHKLRSQMTSRNKQDRRSSDGLPNSPGSSSSFTDPVAQKQLLHFEWHSSSDMELKLMIMKASQLSRFDRDDQLVPLLDNGWNMVDGRDAVNKTFLFQSFNEAWSWMSRVALAGERMGHHPEWFNVYNTVQITWTTPECNGLSARDIKMAHFCDSTFKYYK